MTRQHVVKAAAVADTAFYSKFEGFDSPKKTKIYKHGQYVKCETDGTFGCALIDGRQADDHHSPLNPESYLRLRVEPQLRFYQQRMPKYYRTRSVSEALLIAGALSGTLMVMLNVSGASHPDLYM
jgi:hypothetical protein